VKLKNVEKKTDVRFVTFKIEKVVTDNTKTLKEGSTFTVKQLPEVSRPVKEGETLLWYLAPSDPDWELTQPVGVDSGHFKITDKGNRVINLKGNKDLMNVPKVKEKVDDILKHVTDEKKRERLKGEIMSWSKDRFKKPGKSVPLDLLIARTKMLAE
jgi:hypothetical protein